MSVIDHKAEAEKIATGFGDTGGSTFITRERYIAEAQVHATLALVEQQQVANMIGCLAIKEERGSANEAYYVLDAQVRERLGLA